MFTSPMNMYLRDRDRAQGRDEADAEPDGDRPRDVRRGRRSRTSRGSSCSTPTRARCADAAPRCALRTPRASRSTPRDRVEGRRGHGRDRLRRRCRRPVGVGRRHRRSTADTRVRAHHVRGDLGVHELQGVRRDLPGQHRDPRQDPRHAPLPHADGERLPDRARQHVPLDGELRQRVRPEPGRARRLGRAARRRRRSSRPARRSTTSTSTSSAARAASTTATRRRAARSAKLLQRAGIDFAILGPSELCNGDPARRSGNEYIFQMLAHAERRDVQRHGRHARSSRSARTAST